jgi:ribonuclease E
MEQRPSETIDASLTPSPDLPELPSENLAAPEEQASGESAERNESGRREKRSRDRYGRERKPRGDRAERSNGEGTEPFDTQSVLPLETQSTTEDDAAPRKSYFSAPTANAAPAQAETPQPQVLPAATVPIGAAAAASDASVGSTVVSSTVTVVATPITSTIPAALPKVPPYRLPLEELSQIAQQSGLQWVLSSAEKVAAAQASIADQVQPVRKPRVRLPVAAPDERPLMLVETKRDLRNITLPFETTQVN